MPWGDLGLHSFALVVYPGAALVLGVGLLAGGVAGRVLAAPMLTLPPPLQAVAAVSAPSVAAAVLLAVLAATQLAIPFNPVSSTEQSVLVAVVAVVAAASVASAESPAPRPGLGALAHAGWLVAMLGPAVAAGTLRPTVLAAIAVPIELPVKVAAAILALLCLPAVLELLPETRPRAPAVAPLALWLPCCGLYVSVFLPPASADLLGLARFAGEMVVVGAAALFVAVLVRRRARLGSLYWPALAVLAAFTTVLAALGLIG